MYYKCPVCGGTEVIVHRTVYLTEYWDGEEYEVDDSRDERSPEDVTTECQNCGEECLDPIAVDDEWLFIH